jgi:hypothetical protein
MKDYNKEDLEKLIFEDKLPYEEIGKQYGCSGGNIRKISKKLGIILPQRRKINPNETFNKGTTKKVIEDKPIKIIAEDKFCLYCHTILNNPRNIYCDITCEKIDKKEKNYQYFLNNPEEFQRANFQPKGYIKESILEEQNYKCSICGQNLIWNGKPLVLILDHIDGDASNNTRQNFRCVCPNCDSQLDTYKSKNKNSARTDRNKYYGINHEIETIL